MNVAAVTCLAPSRARGLSRAGRTDASLRGSVLTFGTLPRRGDKSPLTWSREEIRRRHELRTSGRDQPPSRSSALHKLLKPGYEADCRRPTAATWSRRVARRSNEYGAGACERPRLHGRPSRPVASRPASSRASSSGTTFLTFIG